MKKIDELPANPSSEANSTTQGVSADCVGSSNTPSRRAWLRRGVAVATPVIVSLASAPVYAATNVCVLPSGFMSVTTFASRHPGAMVCVTSGPSYWQRQANSSWPNGGATTATKKFKDVFAETEGIGNKTLREVLDGSLGSELARYCIAAYLNALNATNNFPTQLTPTEVIKIYQSFHGGGASSLLIAGWSQTETVTWLKTLMSA